MESSPEQEWVYQTGARHLLKSISRPSSGTTGGTTGGTTSSKTSNKAGNANSGTTSSRTTSTTRYYNTQGSSGVAAYAFYVNSRPNRYRNRPSGSTVYTEESKCTMEAVEDTKELIMDVSDGLATDQAESPDFAFTSAEHLSVSAVKTNGGSANYDDLVTAKDAIYREFELMRDVSCDASKAKLSWYGYNVVTNPYKALEMNPTTQYNDYYDPIEFKNHNFTCIVSKTRHEVCEQAVALPEYTLSAEECIQALNDVGSCSEYTASSGVSLVPSAMLMAVLWKMICSVW